MIKKSVVFFAFVFFIFFSYSLDFTTHLSVPYNDQNYTNGEIRISVEEDYNSDYNLIISFCGNKKIYDFNKLVDENIYSCQDGNVEVEVCIYEDENKDNNKCNKHYVILDKTFAEVYIEKYQKRKDLNFYVYEKNLFDINIFVNNRLYSLDENFQCSDDDNHFCSLQNVLLDGNNVVDINVIDKAKNNGKGSFWVFVDENSPDFKTLTLKTKDFSNKIKISYDVEDQTSLKYYIYEKEDDDWILIKETSETEFEKDFEFDKNVCIKVKAIDKAGNEAEEEECVKTPLKKPSLDVNCERWYNKTSLTINLPENTKKIKYYFGKEDKDPEKEIEGKKIELKDLNEGSYYLNVSYKTDENQKYSEINKCKILIDKTKPTIEDLTISQDGNKLIIDLNAKDNLSGIEKVEIYVNNKLFCTSTRCEKEYSQEGNLKIKAKVYDKAGNEAEEEKDYNFTTKCTTKINIVYKKYTNKKEETIEIKSDKELKELYIIKEDKNIFYSEKTKNVKLTVSLEEKNNVFTIKGKDDKGNLCQLSFLIIKDENKPEIKVKFPKKSYDKNIFIDLNVCDNQKLESIKITGKYKSNNFFYKSYDSNDNCELIKEEVELEKEGYYYFTITATDKAENKKEIKITIFRSLAKEEAEKEIEELTNKINNLKNLSLKLSKLSLIQTNTIEKIKEFDEKLSEIKIDFSKKRYELAKEEAENLLEQISNTKIEVIVESSKEYVFSKKDLEEITDIDEKILNESKTLYGVFSIKKIIKRAKVIENNTERPIILVEIEINNNMPVKVLEIIDKRINLEDVLGEYEIVEKDPIIEFECKKECKITYGIKNTEIETSLLEKPPILIKTTTKTENIKKKFSLDFISLIVLALLLFLFLKYEKIKESKIVEKIKIKATNVKQSIFGP